MMTLPSASTPWTWKTDLAMSRPIVGIVVMLGSSKLWGPEQPTHSWHSRAGGGAVHSIRSGLMHRSKHHRYSITSSAMESSPNGASLQSFSAALARVSRRTHAWMRLRAAALQRDGYTCAVPGWGNATHVDHVVSRRSGGLDNLRSLCAVHDGQINEDNNGKRKSDGKPYLQNQNMF